MSGAMDLAERIEKAFGVGVDAFVECFAPDGIEHHPMFPTPLVGHDAIRQAESTMFEAFDDVVMQTVRTVEQGDLVVLQQRVTARNTGEIVMPDGNTIPATGRLVDPQMATVVRLDDEGRIAEAHRYQDNVTFLRQLGLA